MNLLPKATMVALVLSKYAKPIFGATKRKTMRNKGSVRRLTVVLLIWKSDLERKAWEDETNEDKMEK